MVQKLHGVFKSTGIPQGMATGPASVLADGQYVAMYRHIRLDEGVRGTVM